jgi:hypothetical protein
MRDFGSSDAVKAALRHMNETPRASWSCVLSTVVFGRDDFRCLG